MCHLIINLKRIHFFLEPVKNIIQDKIIEELKELDGLKFQLALKILLSKQGPAKNESDSFAKEYASPVFRHNQEVILQVNEIDGAFEIAKNTILKKLEEWTQNGSGWTVERVEILWLDIARYQPLKGGSYIELPKLLMYRITTTTVYVGLFVRHYFQQKLMFVAQEVIP